ncbi:UxaA family hydrolase [Bengtsoniella intestinalis]|uniref:UxaA family hydrolase n=1 Tax=Bengtsoniella intestinalis TaxID=3073143 RepID=UPI00391FB06D
MKAEAIMLKPTDNVVTVVGGAAANATIHYFKNGELCRIVTCEEIPPCHKIAIVAIGQGERIIKYGESIGAAQRDIPLGGWVSHLNVDSLPRDYASELG